jgi:hypothetical protein
MNDDHLRRELRRCRTREIEEIGPDIKSTATFDLTNSPKNVKIKQIRKSRTEPSFGSYSTHASTDLEMESDFRGCTTEVDSNDSNSDYQSDRLEYTGIALPNDILAFLHIPSSNEKNNERWEPEKQPECTESQNVSGGEKHLHLLAQQNIKVSTG